MPHNPTTHNLRGNKIMSGTYETQEITAEDVGTLDVSELGLTETETNADAEAEASREDRGASSEDDQAALAEEAGHSNSDPDEDALEEADSAPTLRAGVVPGTSQPTSPPAVGRSDSNLTSRAQRKNRQRGR
jgi:hypothetical protein